MLEVESVVAANSPIIVDQQWSREDEQQMTVEVEQRSVASAKSEIEDDSQSQMYVFVVFLSYKKLKSLDKYTCVHLQGK